MFDRNLTQVLRLTAQMENKAAEGEWGVVQDLNAARLAVLEELDSNTVHGFKDRSEVIACLLTSNRAIASLAREAKSNLQFDWQQLVRGRRVTGSYQQIQSNA